MKNNTGPVSKQNSDIELSKGELAKLVEQEERYVKAYGAGAISVDKLKEHTEPLRAKIEDLKSGIAKVESKVGEPVKSQIPAESEIGSFARKASQKLQNLSFKAKQAIVRGVVDKVVENKQYLHVYGYLPVSNHVVLNAINRNCGAAERGEIHSF